MVVKCMSVRVPCGNPAGAGTRNARTYGNNIHMRLPLFIRNRLQRRASEVPPRGLRTLGRWRANGGIMLMEALVAAAVLVMTTVGATHALLTANRLAASSRVLTSARAVVQRNIDTALTVTFTQASQPAILGITSASGSSYNDQGGYDSTIQIATQDIGGTAVATGTLTRIVTAVANADGADIRQVTFRMDYTYGGRNQSVSMTTMRSIDD